MTADTDISQQHMQRIVSMICENRGTYFEWLGLTQSATMKEIDAAYHALNAEIGAMTAAATTTEGKTLPAATLSAALARAYETLTDYGKRTAYEKRGYRPEDYVEVKEDPVEQARTLHRKARTLYGQKNFELGIKFTTEAIRLQPDRAEYYLLLGLCQTEIREQKRQAEVSLLKAVELEPWNAEHYVALGLLFHSERLIKRAEVHYRKALALEPGHATARRRLAEITGPTKNPLDKLKGIVLDQLQKSLPSIFKRGGKNN